MEAVDRAAWFGGLEHFDDDHTPAPTGGAVCQGTTGEFLVLLAIIRGGVVVGWRWRRHGEKLATASELLLAVAVGQEAIVSDALKALGQDV